MDFTQYSQLLSYVGARIPEKVLDIRGQQMVSAADDSIDLRQSSGALPETLSRYDRILCRFALSLQSVPYPYLVDIVEQLHPDGYVILQDYVMPDDGRVENYINGFLHIFDKKHQKSFAQYAWDGLLLDVGLTIQAHHQRTLKMSLQEWIEHYQPDQSSTVQAQVMLSQAPEAVVNTMQLRYQGTVYAAFELQEIVCVAQKEA